MDQQPKAERPTDSPATASGSALEQSSQTLARVIRHASGLAVLIADPQQRILYANTEAERFFVSAGRLLGRRLEELHPTLERLTQQLTHREKCEGEIELPSPDGRSNYLRASLSLVREEDDRPSIYVLHGFDVTQAKHAEQTLENSQREASIILDNLNEMVCFMDPELRIRWANRAACRNVEESVGDLIGRRCHEIWHDRGDPCPECPVVAALESGEPQSGEMSTPDGRAWLLQSAAVRNERGEVTGVVETGLDITQRRKMEDELRAAKIEAERACRMKSQFLANVSHEIRTPLNGIIGISEGILESRSLEHARQQAETILRESEHLMGLINTLLDHAKIEAGKLELECVPLGLDDLLESIVSSTQSMAVKKNIELKVDMDHLVPLHVLGDPLRLRQVLLNLVTNAIKFTQEGCVKIRVESLELHEDWATVRFSVTDTGIGIPREKQRTIFESFTQVDGSTTRQFGGTGLGTTIARDIVRLMGGDMGLESELGKGSTFWFNVDVGICREPQEPPSFHTKTDRDVFRKAEKIEAKILVAEDYPTNQEVAMIHLGAAGYKVQIAADGKEALEACRNETYDLIFMDVQMPEMDGLTAVRRIREELPHYADVPIVALTANGEVDTHLECLQAGMNDVVVKPVRRDTLLSAVVAWLGKDQPRPKEEDGLADDVPAPVRRSTADVIDWDRAAHEFGGDPQLVMMVLDGFLGELPDQIAGIRGALERGDAKALAGEAHKIKGGAANLTADPLSAAAAELEDAAKTGRLDAAEGHVERIEKQFFLLQQQRDKRKSNQ